MGAMWDQVRGLDPGGFRRRKRERRAQQAPEWARVVLDRAVEHIADDPNTELVSAVLDREPGYVRLVYRSRWWPHILGYRALVGESTVSPRERRDFGINRAAERISRLAVCEPLGNRADLLTTDGGIEWWGSGYPTASVSSNAIEDLDGLDRAVAADDLAWSQWRARGLTPVTDVSAAQWLASGPMATSVAECFEVTARLSNPAQSDGEGISELPEPVLIRIAQTLARHTATPEECWYCVWTGYGWHTSNEHSFAFYHPAGTPAPPPPPPVLPSLFRSGPFADIEGRSFFLFTGAASAAPNMGWNPTPSWFWRQWADFVWPADRAWLVFCDVDEDTIDVSGTPGLIAELTAIAGLDVDPRD